MSDEPSIILRQIFKPDFLAVDRRKQVKCFALAACLPDSDSLTT